MKKYLLFAFVALMFVAPMLIPGGVDAKGTYGSNVDDVCASKPYSGNCSLCHLSDRGILTKEMEGYLADGPCYFCPGNPIPEICGDGLDNDCNGLTDNADPTCQTTSCTDVEICGDGIDNDCNGLTDNADPTCQTTSCTDVEICGDGIDNDCNGWVDNKDPACFVTGTCADFDGDRAGCKGLANCNYVGKTKTCVDVNAPPTDCSVFNNLTDCKSNGCRWSRKDGLCK